jgi:hypothetical protein
MHVDFGRRKKYFLGSFAQKVLNKEQMDSLSDVKQLLNSTWPVSYLVRRQCVLNSQFYYQHLQVGLNGSIIAQYPTVQIALFHSKAISHLI